MVLLLENVGQMVEQRNDGRHRRLAQAVIHVFQEILSIFIALIRCQLEPLDRTGSIFWDLLPKQIELAEGILGVGGVTVAGYGLSGTKTLQSAMREAMSRGARTIFMAHHGVLICARSHDEALMRAQLLERLCRRCWQGVLEEAAPVMEQKRLDSVLAKVRHAHPLACAARTDALLTMAALNRPIRAQLDDMAQMIGPVIPVTQSAAAGEISAALDKRCAVLVPGVGAVVCGKDEDDTQALAVLADKAAVCALHTAALGQRAQLSRADIALQHLVYQQKYAKQKEAGK